MDLTISSTVMVSPAFRNTWLPPLAAAASEAVTMSPQPIWPESMASIMSSRVITFVTLAGASLSCSFPFSSTVPVAPSTKTQLFASYSAAVTGTVTSASTRIRHNSLRICIPPCFGCSVCAAFLK